MDHDIHVLGFMVVLHVGLLNVDIHRQVDISYIIQNQICFGTFILGSGKITYWSSYANLQILKLPNLWGICC